MDTLSSHMGQFDSRMGQFDSRMDQFESGSEALYDVAVAAVPDHRRRVSRQPAELAPEAGLPSGEADQPSVLPAEPGAGLGLAGG